MVPDVAPFHPVDVTAGVADDDHIAYLRAMPQRIVGIALQGDGSAATAALVGGDQDGRAAVLNAADKAIG